MSAFFRTRRIGVEENLYNISCHSRYKVVNRRAGLTCQLRAVYDQDVKNTEKEGALCFFSKENQNAQIVKWS